VGFRPRWPRPAGSGSDPPAKAAHRRDPGPALVGEAETPWPGHAKPESPVPRGVVATADLDFGFESALTNPLRSWPPAAFPGALLVVGSLQSQRRLVRAGRKRGLPSGGTLKTQGGTEAGLPASAPTLLCLSLDVEADPVNIIIWYLAKFCWPNPVASRATVRMAFLAKGNRRGPPSSEIPAALRVLAVSRDVSPKHRRVVLRVLKAYSTNLLVNSAVALLCSLATFGLSQVPSPSPSLRTLPARSSSSQPTFIDGKGSPHFKALLNILAFCTFFT
jgi:hypothetical protein